MIPSAAILGFVLAALILGSSKVDFDGDGAIAPEPIRRGETDSSVQVLAGLFSGERAEFDRAAGEILLTLFETDLAGVVAYVRKNRRWEEVVVELFNEYYGMEPELARLSWIWVHPDIPPVNAASILHALRKMEYESVIEMTFQHSRSAAYKLLRSVAKLDRLTGLLIADRFSERQDAERWINDIVRDWAKHDPVATWNGVDQLPKDKPIGKLQGEILKVWFNHDHEAAIEFIQRDEFVPLGEHVFPIIQGVVVHDFDEALNWARALEGKGDSYSALFRELGRSDPELALVAIEAGVHFEAKEPSIIIRDFSVELARGHPEIAFAWGATYKGIGWDKAISRIFDNTERVPVERRLEFADSFDLAGEEREQVFCNYDEVRALAESQKGD